VSVASLGVLRALATAGPVVIAIDDVQWLDAPSARVLAFVVRLEDAPIRILIALRVGSGGDPLGLGQTGPVPLQRVPTGQRVKVIWLRCTSNPLRPSQGPPRAPAYG
jgi:hypothetical protein